MTQTLTGLFDQYDDARRAVQDLEAAGVPHRDVSIVANNASGAHSADAAASEAGEDAGTGAGIGAAVGGVGGLLAGLGLLAIPGLGPVVAAGWLASRRSARSAVRRSAARRRAGRRADACRRSRGGRARLCRGRSPWRHAGDGEGRGRPGRRPRGVSSATIAASIWRRAGRPIATEGWDRFDADAPEYSADQVAAEQDRYRRL